ncbi:hypothetical protein [Aquisalimonas sp.]|uniref:hypothetical protein n=1 Tax=Aquisalimonas sp. TaxID=1872621 RepID=UPI0025BB548F|nr:hypothetical protein [Aquisalimonas sp.]
MLPLPAGREASSGVVALRYVPHRPEGTLLYQLVEVQEALFAAGVDDDVTKPVRRETLEELLRRCIDISA